ncbi:MAG: putative alpha/beta-hydrolase family hydrolase [Hyphomicrobiaceae bacterium]
MDPGERARPVSMRCGRGILHLLLTEQPMTTAPTKLILAFPVSASRPEPSAIAAEIESQTATSGIVVTVVPLSVTESDEALGAEYQTAIREADADFVVIGGFSLGARIAARSAPSVNADALVCFGYPFHKRDDPEDRHGLRALTALTLPTLIVQGTRDVHGNRQQVRSYGQLPACVEMHWLADANHELRLRSAAGDAGQLRFAASAALAFIERVRESRHRV